MNNDEKSKKYGSDKQESIFAIANKYYRNQDYVRAYLLYDYLVMAQSDLQIYYSNRELVRKKIKNKNAFIKRNIDIRTLQVANILAKDKYTMQANQCQVDIGSNPDKFLLKSNIERTKSDDAVWLSYLNSYLSKFSLIPLQLTNREYTCELIILDKLIIGTHQIFSSLPTTGPTVTVMMSCFNAEKTIGYALRSLLMQTYENIEIVVVDDCSTDDSFEIVSELAKSDQRIKIIRNKENRGTYYSRNIVFQKTKCKYFTILDSDDFALPDRISRQISLLEENNNLAGTMSNWLRLSSDGEFIFKNWYGSYLHEAVATLMIRAYEVREKIGYWDSVRYAADTEFQHRIQKTFGKESIHFLKEPVTLALHHEKSLTRDPITGISEESGLSPVRKTYRASWMNWHSSQDVCFLDFPQTIRSFEAPLEMF